MSNSTNKIVSYQQVPDYLQSICNRHKLLNPDAMAVTNRFFVFEENLFGTIKSTSPCVILLPTEFGVTDSGDNVHLNIEVEFMVCVKQKNSDKVSNIAALETAFNIGWDIISVIRTDNRNFAQSGGRYIAQFDVNNVRFSEFPPFGDSLIGYRVAFNFLNPKSIYPIADNFYS